MAVVVFIRPAPVGSPAANAGMGLDENTWEPQRRASGERTTMRIALTHNLKISDSEEEAEFDTPETIDAIASGLERLGHRVERVEVSGPASRTVSRLEAYNPDLVFNTAEGRRGKFREAFYPALFEELGIPFTGSDAYALSVTLDKQTTKMLLAQRGVLSPRGQLVERNDRIAVENFRYPLIVKPNFEGSSKGITQDSVVEEAARLPQKVEAMLAAYPSGVLIEEYVAGRDVTVPFLAAAARETRGVLSPVEYLIAEEARKKRRFAIYDYELKCHESEAVSVRAPAVLPRETVQRLQKAAAIVYDALDIKDLGRIDFRVGDDGQVYFLEINALPSLEPGAGIYASAELEGLHFDGVLNKIVESACGRYGLDQRRLRSRRTPKAGALKVGFTFNVKRVKPQADGTDDLEAEYDPPPTLQAIREAIASYGHEVIDLEARGELPNVLANTQIDVVFNMAEGFKGRNRESQVPALLELLDIPYSGSDPATLAIALDKSLAKRMVRQHGILTPNFTLMVTGKEKLPRDLQQFPLIVKPNAEGSSKGVHSASVVHSEPELRDFVRRLVEKYKQPALVEQYISGREFTVGLLGERRPRVLPIMEVVFLDAAERTPVYSFEYKQDWSRKVRYDVPAHLDPSLQRVIEKAARESFAALNCRDVARIDFRMDGQGRPYFLECNPLPGLTPDWSDLVLISKAAGMDYRSLIGEILAPAIRRSQERARERRREEREEQRPRPGDSQPPPLGNGGRAV
jgi:D-alanine-D-alanine ligase